MKKLFIILCILAVSIQAIQAQEGILPIDPKVRYGQLDNGLTYYIRHNNLPKERAEFFIAQDVGAVLEEDNENGLAHFLEHMGFNGTQHFSGNGVIKYLETIGVKFGQNLNASTGFDQTIYNISDVPLIREGIVDSCLLILHDWANGLLLTDEEIEKERGVIREEMRTHGGASLRIRNKLMPQMFPGNRYGQRNIIGTEEIIMNFKPELIRDFYHRWYRPDLQAIIIVGDFDVDQMEKKVINLFSPIPTPVNPAERTRFLVDTNKEPIVGIATDKEATTASVNVYFKYRAPSKEDNGSTFGFLLNYLNRVAGAIAGERLRDISMQANPPFVSASIGFGSFYAAATERAWQGSVRIKDYQTEEGMKSLIREMERINRYGFTASEYERARTNILTNYEKRYNEREKVFNSNYAREYVGHYMHGYYIPGIEAEYHLINTIAPNITIEMINEYIMQMMKDENVVITYTGPDAKEGINVPTESQLLTWFDEARNEELSPIEDNLGNQELLSSVPQGGVVVKTEHNDIFDAVVYTLSNGVRVVIKPTDHKDDEILMSAVSPGGSSLFPEEDLINLKMFSSFYTVGGLGEFSITDLNKVLAGKRVSLSPNVSLVTEGFSGNSNIKDFETMLQLVYLNFVSPRTDNDAFNSVLVRTKSQLETQKANPDMAFYEALPEALYVNPDRFRQIKVEELSKIDYATIMDWRKNRFADASDFTFIFVGNINPEDSKELIARYLGTLPTLYRNEAAATINNQFNTGHIQKHFDQEMDNPKAKLFNAYWAMTEKNLKKTIEVDILRQILTIIYQETVREEEGGTYGVGVSGNLDYYPYNEPLGRMTIQISFETDPEKAEHLNGIVHREFRNMAENGPKATNLDKVKEYINKQYADNLQVNGFWLSSLYQYYGYNVDTYSHYLETVNAVTTNDIKRLAKEFIDTGNLIEVVMKGKKDEDKP